MDAKSDKAIDCWQYFTETLKHTIYDIDSSWSLSLFSAPVLKSARYVGCNLRVLTASDYISRKSIISYWEKTYMDDKYMSFILSLHKDSFKQMVQKMDTRKRTHQRACVLSMSHYSFHCCSLFDMLLLLSPIRNLSSVEMAASWWCQYLAGERRSIQRWLCGLSWWSYSLGDRCMCTLLWNEKQTNNKNALCYHFIWQTCLSFSYWAKLA